MNDHRIVRLLYALLALMVLNLGVTLYFQLAKPSAGPSMEGGGSDASIQVPEREATEFARGIMDLYNENKVHELYLKFEDVARVEFSEQKLTDAVADFHSMFGKVDEFAYSNSEVAGKDNGRTYLALNYKARLSGGKYNSGTIQITVSRKDGRLGLYGFHISGQTN